MVDIDKYLEFTDSTAIYPGSNTGDDTEVAYLTLGLASEAGEVADKVKKYMRDGELNPEDVVKEVGDVFWYAVRLCQAFVAVPSEVLQMNMDKLSSRKKRGKLPGSGDNR